MLYDSNGLKTYIYVLFFKTYPYDTHIYIYSMSHTPKSIEYQFFRAVSEVVELLRQFSPYMSGLWPGHVWVSGFQPI
jgi:hypothetical protein